jgi:hypothetical protein
MSLSCLHSNNLFILGFPISQYSVSTALPRCSLALGHRCRVQCCYGAGSSPNDARHPLFFVESGSPHQTASVTACQRQRRICNAMHLLCALAAAARENHYCAFTAQAMSYNTQQSVVKFFFFINHSNPFCLARQWRAGIQPRRPRLLPWPIRVLFYHCCKADSE